ncbi:putative uncharacterized protein [Pseudomonas sp. StFLB209]|uniref:hypothetical protein n=1 Tax=Pseudomonas sp. StFLB209 TaxID=1028989 RepID=UPI0004F7F9D9|nr:hypothetical protein [Pseudomonas sp. StFLB209]BAP43943.1 putative uncharacterized protein [Pseudomonas sp. StFLB209]
MQAFASGPFSFYPEKGPKIAGKPHTRWHVEFDETFLAEKTAPTSSTSTKPDVLELFADELAAFKRDLQLQHEPEVVEVIDFETDEVLACLQVVGDVGLTAGLIDDRSDLWLRSKNRLRSKAVTLGGLLEISAKHKAPRNAWMVGVLPDEVTTTDPSAWRAPSRWEIRYVVGQGSFTGVSGAEAAALVGVTPQNFRKYMASEDTSSRQSISFAMWHLLLDRLDIQRVGVASH